MYLLGNASAAAGEGIDQDPREAIALVFCALPHLDHPAAIQS